MFSEQFFDLLLNLGDNWKVEKVYANIRTEEIDVLLSTKNQTKTAELLCCGFKKIKKSLREIMG
ncbi:MAG: hypothetical protein ACLFM7_13745 [Bacteroidales bacterium]